MNKNLDKIADCIPMYGQAIKNLPDLIKEKVTDIRFASGDYPMVFMGTKSYNITSTKINKYIINDLFFKMCENSVYKHLEEIKEGFISLNGKYRVGICGTAIVSEEKIENIKNISSLIIRVPIFVNSVSSKICELIKNKPKGVLIVGEPSSGKTTLLKDLILKSKAKRMVVLDERFELTTGFEESLDVLYAYPKNIAINHCIRNLGTELIICDEFEEKDLSAVRKTVSTGVSLIGTVHGSFHNGIRPFILELIKTNAFEYIVELEGRSKPSVIKKVWETNDFHEKFRCDNIRNVV